MGRWPFSQQAAVRGHHRSTHLKRRDARLTRRSQACRWHPAFDLTLAASCEGGKSEKIKKIADEFWIAAACSRRWNTERDNFSTDIMDITQYGYRGEAHIA